MSPEVYLLRTDGIWYLNDPHREGAQFKSSDPEECAMHAFGCGAERVLVRDGTGRAPFSMTPSSSSQFCFFETVCGECLQWKTVRGKTIREQYPDFGWTR